MVPRLADHKLVTDDFLAKAADGLLLLCLGWNQFETSTVSGREQQTKTDKNSFLPHKKGPDIGQHRTRKQEKQEATWRSMSVLLSCHQVSLHKRLLSECPGWFHRVNLVDVINVDA